MDNLKLFRAMVGKRMSEATRSPFGRWLDGVVSSVDEGRFVVEYVVREDMTNPLGILHGGVVAGMFDDVFGILAYSIASDRPFVTINLYIDYLESAHAGDVVVVDCRVIRSGMTVLNAEATLEGGGRLLARATTNMAGRRRAGSAGS